MNPGILFLANIVVGLVIIGLSLFGLFQSSNISDRNSVFLYLGFGTLFCLVSLALRLRNRLLLLISSIPIIVVSAVLSFILLFAPLAWGDSNMGTVYVLQAISLFIMVLQVASIWTVLSTGRGAKGT